MIGWGTALKFCGPPLLLIALYFGHRAAVSNAFDEGAESRQVEVDTLTTERDVALKDVETLQEDLGACRTTKLQAEADVDSLNSKLLAQAEENALVMRRQAEQFASTQSATNNAMQTLANNTRATDIDFAAILEQLKDVTYEYDADNDRCVIRGGGRLLRDAARGKIGG